MTTTTEKLAATLVGDALVGEWYRADNEMHLTRDLTERIAAALSIAAGEKAIKLNYALEAIDQQRDRAEAAEAKLAEATEYAVKLHMLASEAQAANLGMVGALERLGSSAAFVMPQVIARATGDELGDELKARTEFARAALSGDDVERYKDVLEGVAKRIEYIKQWREYGYQGHREESGDEEFIRFAHLGVYSDPFD